MALYGGRSPRDLTLSDAIMTGFRMVMHTNFVIPILVIGALVNLVVIGSLVPLVTRLVPGDRSTLLGGGVFAGFLGAIVAAVLGGLLLNLYGQVWATMASVGEAPSIQVAFARVAARWMSILGAGIISGLVTLGFAMVVTIAGLALAPLGILLILISILPIAYLAARLSLSGWIAADGAAAIDAVKASWEMTRPRLLLIIGWSIAFGLVFAIAGAILGFVFNFVPVFGSALTQTAVSAFGFGAEVTLYRKIRGA